ncbi:DUF3600 domain-containing protein [Bacillus sp. S2(2024)]|uniref:DUF3600 domain-containing protein n=1 Tax=Bacillus sp. S2(2024) TaxID=3162887 RepID=UPI003D251127
MNLENRVRESLQEKGRKVIIPPELKEKVISQIIEGQTARKKMTMKKRLIASGLVAALLIPTSAFAYQSILADGLYGSFENLKKHVANVTFDGYMTLNAKLLQAKGDLGEKGYKQFKEYLHVITDAKLKYGNKNGQIDFDKMPPKQVAEYTGALTEAQLYFDKFNEDISSKEILTLEEYKQYIKALMTYEKISAQAEVDTTKGPVEVKKLPKELQEEFQQAKDFIDYVNNKQQAIKEQGHTFQK